MKQKTVGKPAEEDGIENRETVAREIGDVIGRYKNVVISGEVGVGKIIRTFDALQDKQNVYYIGNPVDYVGKPRPEGYEKYIDYIATLKQGMRIIAEEKEILSYDFRTLPGDDAIVVIDEIYGRSIEQHRKIVDILDIENVKVILIAGCLKNLGRIIEKFDIVVMLIHDGTLILDKEFVMKICVILGPDRPEKQTGLFR